MKEAVALVHTGQLPFELRRLSVYSLSCFLNYSLYSANAIA